MWLRICVRFVCLLLWFCAGTKSFSHSQIPVASSPGPASPTIPVGESSSSFIGTDSTGSYGTEHVPRLEPYTGCVYTYSFSTSCAAARVGSQRHDNQAAAHATILVNILVLHHVQEAGYHVCRLMLSGMVASLGKQEQASSRSTEWGDSLGKEAYFHWHSDGRVGKVT
jgi:hypothetical protein